MANCAVIPPTDITPDTGPLTFAAWSCLVMYVNWFLTCVKDNGGPQIELLPEANPDKPWQVRAMHDKLYQICPDIMGDAPVMWTRDWYHRVLDVLRNGACMPLVPEGIDGEVVSALTSHNGICKPYTVLDLATLVNRQRYRQNPYNEWFHQSRMATHWCPDGGWAHFLPYGPTEFDGATLWYSFTQNKMVPYTDLIEDDFFYTEDEYVTHTLISRRSANVAIDDATVTNAMPPTDIESPTFQEDYVAWVQAVMHVSPHANTTEQVEIYDSFKQYYSIIPQPLSTAGFRTPQRATYTIPATFTVIENGVSVTKRLANIAKQLWALRQAHRKHLRYWNWVAMDADYPPDHPDRYRNSFCEESGMHVGCGFHTNFYFLRFLSLILDNGDWVNSFSRMLARQWNYESQEIRIDFNWSLLVPIDAAATASGPIPPQGPGSPDFQEIYVLYANANVSTPPECVEAWRF